MGNYMKQVENSRDAVDYSQVQEEALAIARELRTARLAIADERAAFEQAQMGVSAKDDNDDLTDYHQSGSDDEYTDAKSEAGPSWLIAQSPQQSDREIAAEERHVRNNSPTPTPKNLNPTIRAELKNREAERRNLTDMTRLITEQAEGATQGMRDVANDIAKYGDISGGSPAQNLLKQKRADATAKSYGYTPFLNIRSKCSGFLQCCFVCLNFPVPLPSSYKFLTSASKLDVRNPKLSKYFRL